jgi:hypothetical protein
MNELSEGPSLDDSNRFKVRDRVYICIVLIYYYNASTRSFWYKCMHISFIFPIKLMNEKLLTWWSLSIENDSFASTSCPFMQFSHRSYCLLFNRRTNNTWILILASLIMLPSLSILFASWHHTHASVTGQNVMIQTFHCLTVYKFIAVFMSTNGCMMQECQSTLLSNSSSERVRAGLLLVDTLLVQNASWGRILVRLFDGRAFHALLSVFNVLQHHHRWWTALRKTAHCHWLCEGKSAAKRVCWATYHSPSFALSAFP